MVLDTALTPALVEEGIARDFINLVQKKRKDLDLGYTDRIAVQYATTPENAKALSAFDAVIKKETLADSLAAAPKGAGFDEEELGEGRCAFQVKRKG